MRHHATFWASADRKGRQPNEDDIGKPSYVGDLTELDPVPAWTGHLEKPDLDFSGHAFMGEGIEYDEPVLVLDETKEGPADPTPEHD